MYMLTCLSNQNHRCVYLMTDIHVPNLTFDFQLYIKYLTDLLYNFWPWNKISNLSDINLLMYIILHYSAYVVIQRKLMVDLCGNCECVTILLHWRLSHFDAGKNNCYQSILSFFNMNKYCTDKCRLLSHPTKYIQICRQESYLTEIKWRKLKSHIFIKYHLSYTEDEY